jgi:YbbR domain-containing protein
MVAFRNDAPTTFTVSSWGNSWQPNGIENKYSTEKESIIYLSNNQNTLNIKNVTGSIKVAVFNISGQIILSGLSNGKVDISNLIPGIYVISFENHKPQRFVKLGYTI